MDLRRRKAFHVACVVLSLLLLAASSRAFGYCDALRETYPIFQCADRSFFLPPPDFDPQTFRVDPSDPTSLAVQGMTAVFWQIGFGNGVTSSGLGSSGTGMAAKAGFHGNDQGAFRPVVLDASRLFALAAQPAIPEGSVCLGSNDWANYGIDGCCDNPRDPALPFTDDDRLNPYFDVELDAAGYPGLYSLDWQQDYPMAVLLTTESGRFLRFRAFSARRRRCCHET